MPAASHPGDAAGFPVTLSRPGAHILRGNLNVPPNRIGLRVKANYVDIDMNGFRMDGAGKASYGVFASAGGSRIHDGVIVNFKNDGIRIAGANVNAWVVNDMQVIQNGKSGIYAAGSAYSRFLDNNVIVNSSGIICGDYCHLEGNSVSHNRYEGIVIASGTVLGNTIFANGGLAIFNSGGADVGFGNNTIVGNSLEGGPQTSGLKPLQPNVCAPTACVP